MNIAGSPRRALCGLAWIGYAVCGCAGSDAQPTTGTGTGAVNGMTASGGGATAGAGGIPAGGNGGASSSNGASASGARSGGAPAVASGGTSAGGTASGGVTADAATATGALPDDQLLLPDPSWTCGMPDGVPFPETGILVFEATFTVGEIDDFGKTQYGKRRLVQIEGGAVTGTRLTGTVARRGLDLTLELGNGAVEVEQVNVLTASDGALIYLRTCGAAPTAAEPVRMVADFEAPNGGKYAFLNSGTYVGLRAFDAARKTLSLRVYDVTAIPKPASTVKLSDPPGDRQQRYECKTPSGTRAAVVYTESVGIGDGSLTVGASKRGTRNVIPITGGTTSGRVKGTVLSSGADYQQIGAAFELDARYVIRTDDGVLVLVRNCGPLGALVPVFETRADGPYAWLNEDRWLSSDPGIGAGVVNLTIYDTN
jgi:hypothetical protein